MKKIFSVATVLAVLLALSTVCLAASRGAVYIEDNGYYDEKITTAAPGDTVYIALCQKSDESNGSKIDSKKIPTSAKITSAKTLSWEDEKDYKLIKTGSLDIKVLEIDDGCDWYFAVLEIKDIDMDDYPDDGFEVEGKLKVTRKDDTTFTIDLSDSFDAIRYDEAEDDDELGKTPQLYKFKSGNEFELEFPNGEGRFTGTAKKTIEVVAAMNHTKISNITKRNKDADMTFFCGNGAEFESIRDGQLIIEADEDTFLYEIGKNNKLTNVSKHYDDDEEAYVIKTNVLGKYVLSDEKISDTSAGGSDDDDDDDDYEYVYNEDDDNYVTPVYNPVIINPSTGADIGVVGVSHHGRGNHHKRAYFHNAGCTGCGYCHKADCTGCGYCHKVGCTGCGYCHKVDCTGCGYCHKADCTGCGYCHKVGCTGCGYCQSVGNAVGNHCAA